MVVLSFQPTARPDVTISRSCTANCPDLPDHPGLARGMRAGRIVLRPGSCDTVAALFLLCISGLVQLAVRHSGRDTIRGFMDLVAEVYLVRSIDGTNGMNDWIGVIAHIARREYSLGQSCIRFVVHHFIGNLTHPCVSASWLFYSRTEVECRRKHAWQALQMCLFKYVPGDDRPDYINSLGLYLSTSKQGVSHYDVLMRCLLDYEAFL